MAAEACVYNFTLPRKSTKLQCQVKISLDVRARGMLNITVILLVSPVIKVICPFSNRESTNLRDCNQISSFPASLLTILHCTVSISGTQTKNKIENFCCFYCFLSLSSLATFQELNICNSILSIKHLQVLQRGSLIALGLFPSSFSLFAQSSEWACNSGN